jgi:hypothetical protein
MSIWFRGKKRNGKKYYYSVSIPWMLLLITLIGILFALLLPLLHWLRQGLGH